MSEPPASNEESVTCQDETRQRVMDANFCIFAVFGQ
jgi:hypothetical protein